MFYKRTPGVEVLNFIMLKGFYAPIRVMLIIIILELNKILNWHYNSKRISRCSGLN